MTDRYADWDAAYVLGALDPHERREYAAHLVGCEACRTAVADLAALPGLLASVPPDSLPWPAAPPAEPIKTATPVVEPVETTPPTPPVVEPVETTPPTPPPAEPVDTTPPTPPVVEPVDTTPPTPPVVEPVETTPTPAPPDEPVNARQSRVRRRVGLAVAAAVVATGGVVAGAAFGPDLTAGPTTPPTSSTSSGAQAVPLELTPVAGAGMRADLVVTPTPWGTRFEWSCRYDRPPGATATPDAGYDGRAPGPVTYELVLVDLQGARVVAATWTTAAQEATGLAASSSLPLGSLARVEIGVAGREEPLASATL